MTRNMPPADELAWTREEIKRLKTREEELRKHLIEREDDRFGDSVVVTVADQERKRFDRKAAEQELGPLNRFDVTSKSKTLRIALRVHEYE